MVPLQPPRGRQQNHPHVLHVCLQCVFDSLSVCMPRTCVCVCVCVRACECACATGSRVGWLCLVFYLLSLLPFAGVTRVAFLYHYMPSLLFAEVLVGACPAMSSLCDCVCME
ncbi:MAG: hypothetical protein P4L40_15500 [Terracidiphilus sp.]|nr:hypothetical protein [Terracidiphilus sp.]